MVKRSRFTVQGVRTKKVSPKEKNSLPVHRVQDKLFPVSSPVPPVAIYFSPFTYPVSNPALNCSFFFPGTSLSRSEHLPGNCDKSSYQRTKWRSVPANRESQVWRKILSGKVCAFRRMETLLGPGSSSTILWNDARVNFRAKKDHL